MRRTLGTLAFSFLLAACGTVASTVGFPAADANDDDALTRTEFNEFWDETDAYERFDDNDDGNLSREEYNEAVDSEYEAEAYFRGFDTDNNMMLSREEFVGGWFRMFDVDKNGMHSKREFENSVKSLSVEL
jgi:hypothetical protein